MSLTRFFKFALIAFVAVICLMLATRQRISETPLLVNFQNDLVNQIQDNATVAPAPTDQTAQKAENQWQVVETEELSVADEEDTEEPSDDSMPGGYLKSHEPAPINRSHCQYNYELPYDLVYTGKNYFFPPEQGKNSPYRIIYNVTEAYRLEEVPQVTYATHMTANFAYFLPELLKQWEGLVSIAAFVPDLDVAFFLEQINQFCYCEPEMHRVSVHIVTHKLLPFSKKDVYFDRPQNCIPQDSSTVPIFNDYDQTVIYPINVLRNAARTAALTKFILLSDIELMPSKGLASGFLEMVGQLNKTGRKEVFPVPIFEVASDEALPEDKDELLQMLQSQKAVYFHKTTCEHCQKFPDMDKWIGSGSSDQVKPFKTVKRHDPFHRWEPIFIGTNLEPWYSEQLSWEGLQDKMIQSLEMCLQDYNFTILDNAFLCHWPGIKTVASNENWREGFIKENNKIYGNIVKELLGRYKDIPACKAHFAMPPEGDSL